MLCVFVHVDSSFLFVNAYIFWTMFSFVQSISSRVAGGGAGRSTPHKQTSQPAWGVMGGGKVMGGGGVGDGCSSFLFICGVELDPAKQHVAIALSVRRVELGAQLALHVVEVGELRLEGG